MNSLPNSKLRAVFPVEAIPHSNPTSPRALHYGTVITSKRLMTTITYFQRYSQRENHVTNNTLLIMQHFYRASPQKIGSVLSELAHKDLSIGLVFEQQVRMDVSIPDALISQAPLDVYFETKHKGTLDRDQMERHFRSVSNNSTSPGRKIFFGLTAMPVEEALRMELIRTAKNLSIDFLPITFAHLVGKLREACDEHEAELREILSDYESYLEREKLLQVGEILSAFPVGDTIDENIEYRLYFELPSARRKAKKRSKFIGLYKDKCIPWIAQIETIVTGVVNDGGFTVTSTERGELSNDERNRIENAIEYYPHLARELHRYYLFGIPSKTSFVKRTKYGMRNRRDFNLANWVDYGNSQEYSVEEIAEKLNDQEWD